MEESIAVYISSAEQLFKLDAFTEALTNVENALIIQPQNPKYLLLKGRVGRTIIHSQTFFRRGNFVAKLLLVLPIKNQQLPFKYEFFYEMG